MAQPDLICLSGSYNTASYETYVHMKHGGGIGLDNGSVIAVWRIWCTSQPKSDLQNISQNKRKEKKIAKKWNTLSQISWLNIMWNQILIHQYKIFITTMQWVNQYIQFNYKCKWIISKILETMCIL